MIEILAQITAEPTPPKHPTGFCCGIVLWDDKVVEAAGPVGYMKGWSRDRVRTYCARRGWDVAVVNQTPREKP